MNMNALPFIDFILRAEFPGPCRHLSGIFAAIHERRMASQPPSVVNRDYGLGRNIRLRRAGPKLAAAARSQMSRPPREISRKMEVFLYHILRT
jgi:hypothetical protein